MWTTTIEGAKRFPTSPYFRGAEAFGSTASVELMDARLSDFGAEATDGDVIVYSTLTAGGHAVSVDTFGWVSIAIGAVAGDTFTYSVNGGATQTFTLLG